MASFFSAVGISLSLSRFNTSLLHLDSNHLDMILSREKIFWTDLLATATAQLLLFSTDTSLIIQLVELPALNSAPDLGGLTPPSLNPQARTDVWQWVESEWNMGRRQHQTHWRGTVGSLKTIIARLTKSFWHSQARFAAVHASWAWLTGM